MQIIADLHIHSKFSRACSRDLTLENIAATCAIKGVDRAGVFALSSQGNFARPRDVGPGSGQQSLAAFLRN